MLSNRPRMRVLLFVGLAIVALVLLAAGLSNVGLLSGSPLPRSAWWADLIRAFFAAAPDGEGFGSAFSILFAFSMLLLVLIVVYAATAPGAKRRRARGLGVLLWLLALYLLLRLRPEIFEQLELGRSVTPVTAVSGLPSLTPVPETATPASLGPAVRFPQWAIVLAGLALVILAALTIAGLAWLVWHRRRRRDGTLEQLAQEAQEALVALEAGADVRDTVMRCYLEMGRVLTEQRGIKRAEAMTPREFERQLKQRGLPATHVEQLTRLFEGVRYGTRATGKEEELQAVASLAAISEACRSLP